MNIIITGGGTGGHLSVAKAFKEELNKREIRPIYIGSTYGQDRAWFENDEGFSEKIFFDSSGVINKKGLKKIYSLINILKIAKKCKDIIETRNIEAVISVGGYSAAPASFAAILSKTPLFIHEQNAVKGKLNQILSPFAKRVFCSFLPPYDPYPVSESFFEKRRIRKEVKTVIFLGGSQGAKEINDFALYVAKELEQRGIKIIHQTGKKDLERVKKEYEKLDIKVDIFDFDKKVVEKIEKADFAVSRAGASTLWELAANAIPTLFLPYPYAAGNHQEFNARFLVKYKAAFLYDKKLGPKQLLDIIEKDLSQYSKRLIGLTKRGGSRSVIDEIIKS
ncbi:UDP-N-acetylglucosamine--N-acetylmuramyl-(pentapeptide) pyrophosphoryl-undecaprenol N-acetylglucosamine transferase [Nitrosophilus labii]|uniref:UDP-N-acetylglucosamine--N-acetylmuramyl- (pentapeptide) pyrophosphoryl-undecaprenol N-acetylglucosamine transferase n=1 Tax=Nitrosophilus labii TaxID=2706014 RepID=UPI0016571106|nr:UDP-N-acetylglucosamine--N-acetylmuramyl-(pentapeptide) pyrophosphoryl-undecaprenol N-acetylglucosamine transferase [Nitrosophilus labii]